MTQAQVGVGMIERAPNNGAVVSVEQIVTTVNAATKEVALTKGQNPDQCVVFYSTSRRDTDTRLCYGSCRFDVYDNSGTPTLRLYKRNAAYTIGVVAQVVEFQQGVRVQKVAWTSTSNNTSWSASIPVDVDQSRAFIINTYCATVTGSYKAAEAYAVRARFSADDTIALSREATPVHTMTGFCYVVEDISASGKYFAVEQIDFSYANLTTKAESTGSTVDVDKTMVIGNHSDPNGSNYDDDSSIQVTLTDGDTVTVDRRASNTGGNATVFVVEWQNATKVWQYSFNWDYGLSATNVTQTDALGTNVVASQSIVCPTILGHGLSNAARCNDPYSDFNYGWEGQWPSVELDADGEGVTFRHYERVGNTGNGNVVSKYQIVEFEIV